ncbi:MAG: bacteriocin transport accessory protein [Ruminococcaceae bacterium]|nr:bacteriocin transport accessory protein [Oscillospiraceae bacterium]
MKKFIVLCLCAVLLLSLCACGKEKENEVQEVVIENPVALLDTVWQSYAEEEKFPCAGGDLDHANMEGPGEYAVNSAEALDASFGIPAADAASVTEAASLMHMMNLNTFTAGAFRLAGGTDAAAFAENVKANVLQRQWICGFPDTLVIIGVGDYVVSAFGEAGIMETFKTKTLSAYEGAAELLVEQSLAG